MRFEKVSKYEDTAILPTRKTIQSAGYDFYAAEDVVIPPYTEILKRCGDIKATEPLTMDAVAALTKRCGAKVSLVPTGVKCKIPDGYYLQLSVRSSLPLKHWLVLGNSVGIIDADYYNNPDNEGHIYFQLINLFNAPILIKKGDCFGQGILMKYHTTEDDHVENVRMGGFGSTSGQ